MKNSDLNLLGNDITPKLHGNPAKLLPISCHVKIYAGKRGSLELGVKPQACWASFELTSADKCLAPAAAPYAQDPSKMEPKAAGFGDISFPRIEAMASL